MGKHLDRLTGLPLLLEHLGVNQVVDGVLSHLEVVTQANFKALLGVEEVALVQLDLSHQEMAVCAGGVDVVQDVLQGAHRRLEVASKELGLGEKVEGVLHARTGLGHRLENNKAFLQRRSYGLPMTIGGARDECKVLPDQENNKVGVHHRQVLRTKCKAPHSPEVTVNCLIKTCQDVFWRLPSGPSQDSVHVENVGFVCRSSLDFFEEVQLLFCNIKLLIRKL